MFRKLLMTTSSVIMVLAPLAANAEPACAIRQAVISADLNRARLTVTDGDTFKLCDPASMNCWTIRLHGADAPEKKQVCEKNSLHETWDCAGAATSELTAILKDADKLECIKMSKSYGRDVSICTADGKDIAETLIRKGLAYTDTRYTCSPYEDRLLAAEKEAADAKLGVHQYPTQTPWEFRNEERP